jgi:hypothetical protein
MDCLGQLTAIARELWPSTLVRSVARRLGSPTAVIEWFRSLPQADDDGHEAVRFVQCDVPQRVRLLPDDPNCVERSIGAMMLLEALDPSTRRALATVDRPLRHTGLVEQRGGRWHAVDLFPRRNAQRNFDWSELGKDVLQGAHNYVGKPILGFYGLGGAADQLGEQEDKLIGRDKKKAPEKKDSPPAGKPKPERPNPQPQGGKARPSVGPAIVSRVLGTGDGRATSTKEGGRTNGKEQEVQAGAAASTHDANGAGGASPARQDEEAQRWWWSLG